MCEYQTDINNFFIRGKYSGGSGYISGVLMQIMQIQLQIIISIIIVLSTLKKSFIISFHLI